jgi:hypothetical protein
MQKKIKTNKKDLKMTDYMAVGIAEGFEEAENEDQVIEAWQHIYDKRLHLSLQGWFGRTMVDLIEAGYINTDGNKSIN